MAHSRTFLLNPNRTMTASAAAGGTTNTLAKFSAAFTLADSTVSESATETVINDAGADQNVRFESDTNQNHFLSDAGGFNGVGGFAFGRPWGDGQYILVGHPAMTLTASTSHADLTLGGNTGALTVPAGTAPIVSTLQVLEPNITATGTVSDAYTVYIGNAPTEGTRNGALWVASGTARFDDAISKKREGGTAATAGIVTLSGAGTAIIYSTAIGTVDTIFLAPMNASGTAGAVYISTSTNLVSATVASTSGTDTRSVYWWLIKNA